MMTSAAILQEHKADDTTFRQEVQVDKPKIDQLDSYMDAPWRDKNIVHEDENVVVYEDGYPVTEGHLLFVPKKRERQLDITRCFELAYKWGVRGVCDYKWEAFNVGINNGVEAGQSVMWPHVHMIPRREGDTPNPRGGVRNVIPLKGDYKVGIGWGLAKGVAAKRVDDHWKERYEGYREWKEKLPE